MTLFQRLRGQPLQKRLSGLGGDGGPCRGRSLTRARDRSRFTVHRVVDLPSREAGIWASENRRAELDIGRWSRMQMKLRGSQLEPAKAHLVPVGCAGPRENFHTRIASPAPLGGGGV